MPLLLSLSIPLLLSQCAALGPMPEFGGGPPPPAQHGIYTSGEDPSQPHPSSPWAGSQPRPAPRSYSSSSHSSGESPRRSTSFPLDGVVTEGGPGSRTYRDRSSGEIVGNEYTSPAGNTTYRDSSGRITGSSWTSPAGTTTYRDSNGSISLSSSTTEGTGGDNTTTYRRNGTIVGTKYVSLAGNVTWRDGNGQIISGPNW